MIAKLPRPLALLFALALAALCAWCLTTQPPPIRVAKKGGYTDVHLYKDIASAVAQGEPYHEAAARIQRLHHYPLKPFVTMRPPTLVVLGADLGWQGVQVLCVVLMALGTAAWLMALRGEISAEETLLVGVAVFTGGTSVFRETLMILHEYPAGLCLSLAMALFLAFRKSSWPAMVPVAMGLAVRELVLPFALLALLFMVVERRWKEAAGWVVVIAGFGVFLALHAQDVAAVVRPGDITSQGWHGVQGFAGILKAVIFTSAIQPLPLGWALLVAMLPMVGWLTLTGRTALFCLTMVAGYAVMIAVFSRADTFYWGAIMLPWYFVGFALLPRALWQLIGALRGRPLEWIGPRIPFAAMAGWLAPRLRLAGPRA